MATLTMDFGAPRFRQSRHAAAPTAAATIRLTARGRLVLRLLLASVATALLLLTASVARNVMQLDTLDTGVPVAVHTVVVRSGETLWQIAAREYPGTDPREGIALIRASNGLSASDALLAGETLAIPTA